MPSINSEVWSCPMCNSNVETIEHVFLGCDIARIIWIQSDWNIDAFESFHISSWIKAISEPSKYLEIPSKEVHDFQLFAAIAMDMIWYSRNQVVHNSSKIDMPSLLKQLRHTVNS